MKLPKIVFAKQSNLGSRESSVVVKRNYYIFGFSDVARPTRRIPNSIMRDAGFVDSVSQRQSDRV